MNEPIFDDKGNLVGTNVLKWEVEEAKEIAVEHAREISMKSGGKVAEIIAGQTDDEILEDWMIVNWAWYDRDAT